MQNKLEFQKRGSGYNFHMAITVSNTWSISSENE